MRCPLALINCSEMLGLVEKSWDLRSDSSVKFERFEVIKLKKNPQNNSTPSAKKYLARADLEKYVQILVTVWITLHPRCKRWRGLWWHRVLW